MGVESGYRAAGIPCSTAVGWGVSSTALEVLAKISRVSGTSMMSEGLRSCDIIADTDCVSGVGRVFPSFELSILTMLDEISGRVPTVEEPKPRLLFNGSMLYC